MGTTRFIMSNRLDQEREKELQPERIEYAKKQIETLGYEIAFSNETEIQFLFKGNVIRFYPYSGWHQGTGIKAGRGLQKLLTQVK